MRILALGLFLLSTQTSIFCLDEAIKRDISYSWGKVSNMAIGSVMEGLSVTVKAMPTPLHEKAIGLRPIIRKQRLPSRNELNLINEFHWHLVNIFRVGSGGGIDSHVAFSNRRETARRIVSRIRDVYIEHITYDKERKEWSLTVPPSAKFFDGWAMGQRFKMEPEGLELDIGP